MLKSPIIGLLFWGSSVIVAKCLSNVRAEMLPLVLKNQHLKQDKPSRVMENLAPVTCFQRLSPVACFPAHGISSMFTCLWRWSHVFPRLATVSSFRAL